MTRGLGIILFLCALFSISNSIKQEKENKILMCYLMSWSIYRPNQGKFNIDDIDANLCTHIIYSYHIINDTTWELQTGDHNADVTLGGLRKLVNLKKDNKDLKIMISVGGWTEGSTKFSQMASSRNKRFTFEQSVVEYLEEHELDGLDIDWQFPAKRGGVLEDKTNFVTLLRELHNKFQSKGFILSVNLRGLSYYATDGYDLPKISDSVDYVNLRSYSYHGSWEHQSGINSPLNSNDESNVVSSVNYLLNEGVDNNKLLLGLSTQGIGFIYEEYEIKDGKYIGKNASKGFQGPWVNQNGVFGFNELELVSEKNLGGASLFSLDTDDFGGHCYDEVFILTTTVSKYLSNFNLNHHVLGDTWLSSPWA